MSLPLPAGEGESSENRQRSVIWPRQVVARLSLTLDPSPAGRGKQRAGTSTLGTVAGHFSNLPNIRRREGWGEGRAVCLINVLSKNVLLPGSDGEPTKAAFGRIAPNPKLKVSALRVAAERKMIGARLCAKHQPQHVEQHRRRANSSRSGFRRRCGWSSTQPRSGGGARIRPKRFTAPLPRLQILVSPLLFRPTQLVYAKINSLARPDRGF